MYLNDIQIIPLLNENRSLFIDVIIAYSNTVLKKLQRYKDITAVVNGSLHDNFLLCFGSVKQTQIFVSDYTPIAQCNQRYRRGLW